MNNTGLPLATLISFAGVMIGLSIGWIVIIFYKQKMERAATLLVQERLVSTKPKVVNLERMLSDAKTDILESQTFVQRYFSLKTVHGVFFLTSWFQIAGRIFASNQTGDNWSCYTYPVYKPVDTTEGNFADMNLTLVPVADPEWDDKPWANGPAKWSSTLIFGTMVFGFLAGAVWTYCDTKIANKRMHAKQDAADADADAGVVEKEEDVQEEEAAPEETPPQE
jgi:hypothetical protein